MNSAQASAVLPVAAVEAEHAHAIDPPKARRLTAPRAPIKAQRSAMLQTARLKRSLMAFRGPDIAPNRFR
jgi:hypothetical protein